MEPNPFYVENEQRLPLDDVEAFLDCARYNEEGDADILRDYLTKNPRDIDAKDNQGRTAVHMAAANGHMPILEMLFEFNPKPDVPNYEGNTALHFAALNNRLEAARRLLEKGWKVSSRNVFDRTPLQLSQDRRLEEMTALLLQHDETLDSYVLPPGAIVTGGGDDEDDEEDGHGPENTVKEAARAGLASRQPPHAQQPAKRAVTRPTPSGVAPVKSAATAKAAASKPNASASAKEPLPTEEAMLGSANVDGIE